MYILHALVFKLLSSAPNWRVVVVREFEGRVLDKPDAASTHSVNQHSIVVTSGWIA